MIDYLILYRDWGRATGVTVSVNHLLKLMNANGFSNKVIFYHNDEELLEAISCNMTRVIMLQAPTFKYDTLIKILDTGRNTVLVVHSTISYLQAEADAFENVQKYLQLVYRNFMICNPCQYEVEGFRSYAKTEIIYLPNTFNQGSFNSESDLNKKIKMKQNNPQKKISIFCDYRPFKNIATQITACSIASKQLNLELHMFIEKHENSVYKNIKLLLKNTNLPIVWHDKCGNKELHDILDNMTLGLQVSYSETFSYIIFEHMIHGIPTIASTTVPFASIISEFNDAKKIADKIYYITQDIQYSKYAQKAIQQSENVRKKNNKDALKALKIILRKCN
jgi:glycosyltransferase involved in cell wall biosynthesis